MLLRLPLAPHFYVECFSVNREVVAITQQYLETSEPRLLGWKMRKLVLKSIVPRIYMIHWIALFEASFFGNMNLNFIVFFFSFSVSTLTLCFSLPFNNPTFLPFSLRSNENGCPNIEHLTSVFSYGDVLQQIPRLRSYKHSHYTSIQSHGLISRIIMKPSTTPAPLWTWIIRTQPSIEPFKEYSQLPLCFRQRPFSMASAITLSNTLNIKNVRYILSRPLDKW